MNKRLAVSIAAAFAAALLSYATPGYEVGEPELVSAAPNSLTLSAEVTGFGDVAQPATLKFVYGIAPDAMFFTNVVSASVSGTGPQQAKLSRLSPATYYYVKAVIETNDGQRDAAESATVCLKTVELVVIPGEYRYLDYIETTGKQHIDTGLYPDRTLRVVETLSTTDTGTDKMTFGVRNCGYAFLCWLGKNAGTKVYPAIGTSGNIANRNSGKSSGQKWTLDMGADGLYVDSAAIFTAAEFAKYTNTTSVSSKTLLLFGLNDTKAESRKYVGKCYSFKAYQGGSLVRDLVPAKRTSDGVVGMYDFANDEFYVNKGTETFGAGPILSFEAEEIVENNSLTSVALTFEASSASRVLSVACGPDLCGDDPADWPRTNAVATIAAGVTSYVWTVPSDWGSDTNLVARFFFDETPVPWSNAILWRNHAVPSVTDVTLDGTGGDTIIVSGDLDFFSGASCTLSVHVGTSPDALDNAWTGLANSTRTETGAFSLTLCEPDTAAARHLKPGVTYYVSIQALANGLVTRTDPVPVTMKAAPTIATATASATRRTVTFTGRLSDLGMNDDVAVTLYAGPPSAAEEDLVAVEPSVTIADTASFTITHTFDAVGVNYKWQLRAVSTAVGGTTTAEARSAVSTVLTLDTTTYTWKTTVASGNWSDPANWTDNQGGDCVGYPQSSAASAVFGAGTTATVVFTEKLTIGDLNMASCQDVAFVQGGASTNATKLTVSSATWSNNSGNGGSITLDGVAIASTSGNTLIDTGRALRLVNGANLHLAGYFGNQVENTVVVADGSFLSCNGTYFGGGTLIISNSTFWTRSHDIVGRVKAGGHIVFMGEHPLLYHYNTSGSFYSELANANVQLDFLVPVGGYATPPLQARATPAYYLGNNGKSAGACPFTVNVLDESPANYADATITSTLISWPKGINKARVLEGHLPAYGEATDDAFVWGDDTSYPTTLGVTINGSSHAGQLQVSVTADGVTSSEFSPAIGYSALASGATIPCAAPVDYVYVTQRERAICTGWKLYDVDAATRNRTLADSGAGNTCSVTGNGGWRELEWQYQVEYLVTASGAGGTYTPASQWVVRGERATIETVPDDGLYLYGWTTDGPDAVPVSTSATFTVTAPAAITAAYRGCFWVAPDGDNENDGLTRATAKATLQAALALTSSTVGEKVIVADGDYTLTANASISTPCVVEAEHTGAARFFIGTAGFTAFSVKNADAVLRGVTVYSDRNVNLGAALLSVSSGKVIDCVFSNAICGEHSPVYLTGASSVIENCDIVSLTSSGRNGGGLYITSDATARNCRVRKCFGNNNTYGSALFVDGGWAYGCLVACNTNSSTGTAGLHIRSGKGADGCTVVNNYSGGRVAPGLYCKDGKTARNCLAYGNRNAGGPLDTMGGGSFSYCATGTAAPAGTGNFQLGANPFADSADEDYRVLSGPTLDAGSAQSWMTGASDIAGNPRVSGSAPDIGCYEAVQGALAVAAAPSAAFMLGDAAVTLTAMPAGTNLTGLVFTWLVTDQTGATVASSTDDTSGTIVIPAGYGKYNVTVTASNEVGETATWTGESITTRVPATLYVAKDSTPAFPYNTWETAAADLATALAWCGDGSTVIMGDGIWTNTAAITVASATTIKSLNGADATKIYSKAATTVMTINHRLARIEGLTLFSDHTSRSMAALRIWDGTFADGVISNFYSSNSQIVNMSCQTSVITNSVVIRNETSGRINTIHTTADDFDRSGGQIINCRIIGNVGNNSDYGTAICAYSGAATIRNCLILCNTNKSSSASAVNLYNNSGVLENCTIVGNRVNGSSSRAAVITSGAKPIICNCIIHDNQNTGGVANWSGTASCFTYCCTTPLPSEGNGNIPPVEPMFADDACHIGPGICKDAGVMQAWMATATDLDGGARIADDVVDLGCYEYIPGGLECMAVPSAAFILGPGEVTLTASVSGADLTGLTFTWHVTDQTGTIVADVVDSASATNIVLSLGYGLYDVSLTVCNARGAEAEFSAEGLFAVKPETVYVAMGAEPEYPYDTHEKAFTNVVDAIDFAESGMRVIVADGTYTNASNPTIVKNIVLESENGPDATTIFSVNGTSVGWTLNSSDAVLRGFTLLSDNANGASPSSGRPAAVRVASGTLDGCVVTNWYTHYTPLFSVGGSRAVVTNCLVTGCRSQYRCHFASITSGLIANTRFIRNSDNTASSAYGALIHVNGDSANVRNCLFADNTIESAPPDASVIFLQKGTVENCTVADNAAKGSSTVPAVYVDAGAFRNNIVWGNTNKSGASGCSAASASRIVYSCAPGLTGTGCTEGDPCFHNASRGDYTLRGDSPCIDTGLNQPWMEGAADLGGNQRVRRGMARGTVDMGCFEYTSIPTILFLR